MLALSIRQPYAELILRGVKTVEYRTVRTTKIGERFYIYVPSKWASCDWVPGCRGDGVKDGASAPAPQVTSSPVHPLGNLSTSVIVGSAVISHCLPPSGDGEYGHCWQWHLKDVRRYKQPRKLPRGVQPQPVWFRPYRKAA